MENREKEFRGSKNKRRVEIYGTRNVRKNSVSGNNREFQIMKNVKKIFSEKYHPLSFIRHEVAVTR